MGGNRRGQDPQLAVTAHEVDINADASALEFYQGAKTLSDLVAPKDQTLKAANGIRLPPKSPDSLYNERDMIELIERAKYPVVEELYLTKPVLRLLEVYQMLARATVRGEGMDHVRAVHSGLACEDAVRIGEKLGLSNHDLKKLAVAGLLHDIKHPPGAHQGEYVIHRFDPSFDHDDIDLNDPEYAEVAQVLWKHKINPADINDILNENGSKEQGYLRFIIKECADRISYLKLDSRNSGLAPEVKALINHIAERFEDSLLLVKNKDGTKEVATRDKESLVLYLAARRLLFENEAQHPAAVVAGQLLIQGVAKAVECGAFIDDKGKFDVAGFAALTDKDVLQVVKRVAPEIHAWLATGVERHLTPVMGFRISDLTEEGKKFVESPDFARRIRLVVADLLPSDHETCFACTGLKDDKIVRMRGFKDERKDEVGAKPSGPIYVTCRSPLPDNRRFTFAVIANEVGEAVQNEAAERINKFMAQYLKPEAQSVVDLVFADLFPTLYNGTPLSRSTRQG